MAMDLVDSDIPQLTDVPQDQQLIQDALFIESNYYNNKRFKEKFGDDYGPSSGRSCRRPTSTPIIAGPDERHRHPRGNSFVSPLLLVLQAGAVPAKTDPTDAASMLDAAGWTVGSDGIRAKGGKKLEIEYCTTTRPVPRRLDHPHRVAAEEDRHPRARSTVKPAAAGRVRRLEPGSGRPGLQRASHGNYDVVMHGYHEQPGPDGRYIVYSSKGIPDDPPHNGGNEMRISIPAMDAAWEIVNTSLDPAEIKNAMETIQDIYARTRTPSSCRSSTTGTSGWSARR